MTDTYTDAELLAMPQVNLALLDQTLDYIIEHPDEWDQGWWVKKSDCGTTCCFAGWTVALAGYEFEDAILPTYTVDGPTIEETAQTELGLTNEEAYDLFLGTLYSTEVYDTEEDLKAYRLKAVKIEVERIRYRARLQDQAFARAAEQIGEANSKREVVQVPQSVKVG